MRKNEKNLESRYLQQWPQLAKLALQPDQEPYEVLPVARLEEALTYGERSLVGVGMAIARLDLALAGLWEELGEAYFCNNRFDNRLTAVTEVLLAARTELEVLEEDGRLQVLYDEALSALQQWNHLLRQAAKSYDPLLYAAEDGEDAEDDENTEE